MLEADGRHFLLVTRYDRLPDAHSQPLRLHQEDFCQALGLPARHKYQRPARGANGFFAIGVPRDDAAVPCLDRHRSRKGGGIRG